MKTESPRSAGAGILAYFSVFLCLSRAQPGSLDITFNPGSGLNYPSLSDPIVFCMALETNGQIVIGGRFSTFNGVNRTCVARLNADGSLDPAFDPGAGPNNNVAALAVQPDGKVLIAGPFNYLNGLAWNYVARLRADGSADVGFATGATNAPNYYVNTVALQPDGKVLIGGQFSGVGGTPCGGIARLNTNGTLDATFNAGTGLGGDLYNAPQASALGLQSTGKILVGGIFNTINGVSQNCLARLNSDGSLDTTFNAGVAGPAGDGTPGVASLAVLPQDKIMVVGSFTSVNGYGRSIARLNADGSVDTTFDPGLGTVNIESVAVQGDGKVVIGGNFRQFNGISRVGVARLNSDGSLDLTFNPGTGAIGVQCVAVQPDGKTLIGGEFSQFNGTNINGVARLNGDTLPITNLQFMAANLYFGANLYGAVSNTYRVEWTPNPNTPSLWTPLLDVTLQTNPQFIVDTNLPAGQRFYRAVQISP